MKKEEIVPKIGAACGQSEAPCSLPDHNFIVSLSGGKDSTAMLHWMLERGEKIHSIVFFDTGWEFPAMKDHIDKVERNTGLEVVRLHPIKPFSFWMFDKEMIARKGQMKGRLHRIGNGWPSPMRRWCTREKVRVLKRYGETVENHIFCVGMADDEQHRVKDKRYPLIEYGKSESDCLKYCKSLGYHWDGLYDIFRRVSCFCCPLQRLSELRKLRKHYPYLWNKMLIWDMKQPRHNAGFHGTKTLIDLECRFTQEEKQLELWAVA